MNMFKTSLLATALIAGGAIAPANADDSAPLDFDVTITIDKSCDIKTATDIGFGNRLASAGTATATGGITVQCTLDVPYDIALNAGNNGGSDVTDRKMLHTNGTNTIAYSLYQDSGHSKVWGNTLDTNTVDGTGIGFDTGSDIERVVYAEATIPGTALVGTYSDTITATVTF